MPDTVIKVENHNSVFAQTPGHFYILQIPFEAKQSVPPLSFQNGTVKEVGVNGWQNEEVIAVLIDRIKHLNSLFPSKFNESAICGLEVAEAALLGRTRERMARGVEGHHAI